MANPLTPVEQINKYEYTPEKILKMLGWDRPDANGYKYKAVQDLSSSALTEYKRNNNYQNTQLCGWKIQRKPQTGGQWTDVPKSEIDSRLSSARINSCATTLNNGLLIIYKPYEAGQTTHVPPNERNTASSTPVDTSYTSTPMGESGGISWWYEVLGFKSNDEEMMKKLKFAQVCLLKECYEWTGHIF